jgi:hypothetical protein
MAPDHLMTKIHWLQSKERQIATLMGSSAVATIPLIKGRVADLHRRLETLLWLLGEDPP